MGDLWGSIALADECKKHSDEILFVISGGDEAIAVLRERGYQYRTVESDLREQEVLRAFHPDTVLVNKLNNPPTYIKALKELTDLVVTIDDAGEGAQSASLKINVLYHTPGAVTDPQYATMRDEFREIHKQMKTIRSEVRELLITQGGSDTYGFTPRILRALEQMDNGPHCTVVVGPAFLHEAELRETVGASKLDLTVVRDARNMAKLMWNADLAITAGGLTMFELACAGTPSLVVCAEPFEVETAARLEKAGAVVNLGFGEGLDYARLPVSVDSLGRDVEIRDKMSRCGKQLVDGKGCERIVGMIRERVLRGVQSQR
jgi:UDP-2,4-diacetamido-2,4,6-trideoxy-beta-L-altropyranose hydrolase